mmetsp:Transcript_101592/g.206321  ORF Transcript_101592/g.206321 Transcript_101592/m.206321 type:complete len:620 (+) Transcript_101592:133-1992(+)
MLAAAAATTTTTEQTIVPANNRSRDQQLDVDHETGPLFPEEEKTGNRRHGLRGPPGHVPIRLRAGRHLLGPAVAGGVVPGNGAGRQDLRRAAGSLPGPSGAGTEERRALHHPPRRGRPAAGGPQDGRGDGHGRAAPRYGGGHRPDLWAAGGNVWKDRPSDRGGRDEGLEASEAGDSRLRRRASGKPPADVCGDDGRLPHHYRQAGGPAAQHEDAETHEAGKTDQDQPRNPRHICASGAPDGNLAVQERARGHGVHVPLPAGIEAPEPEAEAAPDQVRGHAGQVPEDSQGPAQLRPDPQGTSGDRQGVGTDEGNLFPVAQDGDQGRAEPRPHRRRRGAAGDHHAQDEPRGRRERLRPGRVAVLPRAGPRPAPRRIPAGPDPREGLHQLSEAERLPEPPHGAHTERAENRGSDPDQHDAPGGGIRDGLPLGLHRREAAAERKRRHLQHPVAFQHQGVAERETQRPGLCRQRPERASRKARLCVFEEREDPEPGAGRHRHRRGLPDPHRGRSEHARGGDQRKTGADLLRIAERGRRVDPDRGGEALHGLDEIRQEPVDEVETPIVLSSEAKRKSLGGRKNTLDGLPLDARPPHRKIVVHRGRLFHTHHRRGARGMAARKLPL